MGLPLLEKYNYKIENNSISLDNNTLSFQIEEKPYLKPDETQYTSTKHKISTIYLDGKPTTIFYINTGNRIYRISNEITSQLDKVDFTKIIPTKHIEPALRESIEKNLYKLYRRVQFKIRRTALHQSNQT